MKEDTQASPLPSARVATRPGASGIAEHRRRLYQRHLLVFLAINGGLVALDLYTGPGLQFAHFLAVPWLLVFLLHTVGLKSRGYSFGELLIPPRVRPVQEVYTTPLDYELVRARQLRDGITNAAAAAHAGDAEFAKKAEAAADALVRELEQLVAKARSTKYRSQETAEKLVPEAQSALDALYKLHDALIRVSVLEESPVEAAAGAVEERVETVRKLIR